MPPKLRLRPAANLGGGRRGRAKAKALPKAAARPARRRPATEGEVEKGGVDLDWRSLSAEQLAQEKKLVFVGGYWDSLARFAGHIEGWYLDAGEKYLSVKVGGTQHEGLLRYLSGQRSKVVQVHCCPDPCPARVWRDGLIHLDKVTRPAAPEEAWMTNAMEVLPPERELEEDEMGRMREDAKRLGLVPPAREARSRSRRRKKSAERTEGRIKEGEVTKEKSGARASQKNVEDLFRGTGLDPDPQVRKKLMRRGRRLAEKKKKTRRRRSKKSSRGGSTSTCSTSDSASSSKGVSKVASDSLFTETSTVKRLARELPGVLAANWMEDCKDYLLNSQGMVWSSGEGQVQPLAVQFYRSQMALKLSGPMAREYLTLTFLMDLLVQGRAAEAMDVACQRAKSLASTGSGIHYTISQQLEVVPVDKLHPASLAETQEAARAMRQEERVFHQAARTPRDWRQAPSRETGGKDGKGRDGKGKKGKGKEGKGKDESKGHQAEGKKG